MNDSGPYPGGGGVWVSVSPPPLNIPKMPCFFQNFLWGMPPDPLLPDGRTVTPPPLSWSGYGLVTLDLECLHEYLNILVARGSVFNFAQNLSSPLTLLINIIIQYID